VDGTLGETIRHLSNATAAEGRPYISNQTSSSWLPASTDLQAKYRQVHSGFKFACSKGAVALDVFKRKVTSFRSWYGSRAPIAGLGILAALQRRRKRAQKHLQDVVRDALDEGWPFVRRKWQESWHWVAMFFLCVLLLLGSPRLFSGPRVSRSMELPLPAATLRRAEKDRVAALQVASRSTVAVSGEVAELGKRRIVSNTGWVLDKRGYIITSYDAVSDIAAPTLSVNFAEQPNVPAVLQGVDKANNLAVLKVRLPRAGRVSPVPLRSSSKVSSGQDVYVIGNPFGAAPTLSRGIVSGGKGSTSSKDDGHAVPMCGVYLIDVAVSAENHGGPVLNSRGEMIGMAVQFSPQAPHSRQVGLLVPSDTLARSVGKILEQGLCQRASLGLDLASTDHFSQRSPYQGATVVEVPRGGAAAKAGVQVGDVIFRLDGRKVTSADDVVAALDEREPGDRVEILLSRPMTHENFEDESASGAECQTVKLMVKLGVAGE